MPIKKKMTRIERIENRNRRPNRAGDWMPYGIPTGIGKGLEEMGSESSDLFYISDPVSDGYKLEEILLFEDMYPTMYKRMRNK